MATQTQIVREAPEVEALKLGLMESAKTLADTPIDIPGYDVEGLTELQKAALRRAGGMYDPTADIDAARLGLTGASQQLTDAQNLILQSLGRDGGAGIRGAMDPYVNEVIDQAQQDIFEQAQMQGNRATAEGIAAAGDAAFGSRGQIQQGMIDRDAIREAGRIGSQLRSAAFTDAANRLGSAAGGIASLAGQGAGFAGQGAGLAQLQQGLEQQGVGFGFDVGAREQAQGQAEIDALRAGNLENLYEPYKRLGFVSDIYQGAPSTQMTTVTGAAGGNTASPFEKLFGYGTAALSGAAGIQSLFG